MLYPDLVDVPIEVFGGYCPAIPPSDLSPGAAAIAQDVIYPQGGMRARGGLSNFFSVGSPIPANAAINGLKSYLTPTLAKRLMAWDSLGNLYKENPQGTLNLLFSRPYANLFYQSSTLFGREYQAFFNSLGGFDIPRQYDDTNWDRVSQVGPGAGPFAAADSGTAGNIAAGTHQVSVCFITRQGFITAPCPPVTWTAAGSKKVAITFLPIGPANVIARLLLFTPVITAPAVTGNFFSLPNGSTQITTSTMLINDNVATSVTLDFTDAILSSGFSANYLFSQLELGESAFSIGYNSRTCWLGERNKVQNVQNFTFDGAWNGTTQATPLGWNILSNGGGSAAALGVAADWGDAYVIVGDGATAVRGGITQNLYQDFLGVPIVQRNTAYNLRVRMAKGGGLNAGFINFEFQSSALGLAHIIQFPFSALTATYQEFDFGFITPLVNPANDINIQVFASGTPNLGGQFILDSIELYPTNTPFNYSTIRLSRAFNPESFDGTTGQIQVRPGDGQQMRAAFPLRNNLYLAKDHYLCYVTDDGINEPSSWAVNEVSGTIGICGPNACDWTEEWAVFAERAGLHICWGSDPVKITPEIQIDASGTGKITWASINWAAAWTISVRIDKVNKMILVSAPVNGATTPNIIFMMDYRWLDSAEDIAGSPLVTYSSFTGKILSHGRGRRWAIWNITANSMTFAERADGTVQPFFGNGAGNGKIYQQLDCSVQASDDGVAVPWGYQGYACPSHMEEQQYQLGSHRKLLGYMKFRALGSGLLGLAISTAQRSTLLRSYALSVSPNGDGERPINMQGERFYPTVRTNATVGAWFQMEKWILCVKKSATIPVRGMSA